MKNDVRIRIIIVIPILIAIPCFILSQVATPKTYVEESTISGVLSERRVDNIGNYCVTIFCESKQVKVEVVSQYLYEHFEINKPIPIHSYEVYDKKTKELLIASYQFKKL